MQMLYACLICHVACCPKRSSRWVSCRHDASLLSFWLSSVVISFSLSFSSFSPRSLGCVIAFNCAFGASWCAHEWTNLHCQLLFLAFWAFFSFDLAPSKLSDQLLILCSTVSEASFWIWRAFYLCRLARRRRHAYGSTIYDKTIRTMEARLSCAL